MMWKGILTIVMLIVSNIFMILAWYGHLKWFKNWDFNGKTYLIIVLVSWGIALLEYAVQVPANRLGAQATGGPYSLLQLKIIQEVITLAVFVIFSAVVFKTGGLSWNHLAALVCVVLAVFFVFK
ncbi:MAG: DMT family protein [Paludibacteraceae bacterium]|nr:DMT family protein [Paludibacteraceae bacterium]